MRFDMNQYYSFDDFTVGTIVACVCEKGKKRIGIIVEKSCWFDSKGSHDYFEIHWETAQQSTRFSKEFFENSWYSLCKLKDWKKFKKQLRGEE